MNRVRFGDQQQGSAILEPRRHRLVTLVVASAALALAFALPAVAAADQTLTVEKKGTGTGTVVSFPAGINCGSTCSASFKDSELVTLTGSSTSGTAAVVWTGCETKTLDNKCKVTMSAAKTVIATFDLAQRELKVTKAGSGSGTVKSTPAGINCGATCAATYTNGTAVTLMAVSGSSTQPVVWSGCAKIFEVSGEKQCEVTMTGTKAVTATFKLNQVELKAIKAGAGTGTVTSSPAGISCGAKCAASFDEGSTVTLTGAPGASTQPVKWSGCSSVNGENKCLVTMSAAKAVTATFNVEGPVLTVTKAGKGTGTVTSSPAGMECGAACAVNFVKNSTVTLAATPGLHTKAAKWSGCDSVNGENKCVVEMSAARSVTATFDLEPGYDFYVLSIEKTGSGFGTVSGDPGSIDCGSVCSDEFITDTVVTFTAVADAGSVFDHWYGGGCSGTGPCEVKLNKAKKIKAIFIAVGQRALTLTKAGAGAGTVKSNPAGIACGATCSFGFNVGKKVTLTATPDAGSSFSGFSGACSGTGPCKVEMTEARSVTATFAKVPTPSSTGKVVVAGKAKVKRGKAFVKINCKGPASCRGSLKLLANLGSGKKGKRHAKKSVAIGSAHFSLAPGSSTTLKVKLSSKAKQLLKSKGQIKAKVKGSGIKPHAVKLKT